MHFVETQLSIGPVYHGSHSHAFDHDFKDRRTPGFWFSTVEHHAAHFGTVRTYMLRFDRLLNLTVPPAARAFLEVTPEPNAFTLTRDEVLNDPDRGLTDWNWQCVMIRHAHRVGYDGVTFIDRSLPDGSETTGYRVYVAFSPCQISVTV